MWRPHWRRGAPRLASIGIAAVLLSGALIAVVHARSIGVATSTRPSASAPSAVARATSRISSTGNTESTPPTATPTTAPTATPVPPPTARPATTRAPARPPTARPAPPQAVRCQPSDFRFTVEPETAYAIPMDTWLLVKTSAGTCHLPNWLVTLHLTGAGGASAPGFPTPNGACCPPGVTDDAISHGDQIPGPLERGPYPGVPPGSYTLWATSDDFGTTSPVTVTVQ